MITKQLKVYQAVQDFSNRWAKAVECFKATDKPKWKSTQDGLSCFKGLEIDNLPRNLDRQIEACFVETNKILKRYPIKTWDDYQMISDEDLAKIQQLITDLGQIRQ